MGILKLDACEYEEGKGHGPAAFANFAYYRAGRADLAGKNVDDVTATGIRKAASREHGSKAYNARNALIKWLNKRLDYANAPSSWPLQYVGFVADCLEKPEAAIKGKPVTGKKLKKYCTTKKEESLVKPAVSPGSRPRPADRMPPPRRRS